MATTTGSKRLLNISADAMASSTTMTLGGNGVATQAWVIAQGYLTSETDSQTLSWNGTTGVLTISGGNSVDLDGRYLQSVTAHTHGIGDVSGLQDAIDAKLDLSVNPIKAATVSNDTITFTRADNTTFTVTTSDANTNYYLNGITKSGNTLTFSVNGTTNQTYTFGSNAFTSYTDHSTQGYLTALPAHTHPISEVDGLQDALDAKQPAGSYLTTTGKAADSNLLDGLDSSVFLRSNAADTATGVISFNAGINTLSINDTSGQQLVICAGEAGIDASQNGELVYVNAENGFQVAASNDNWATGYAGTRKTIIDYNGIRYNGNYVWHAGNDGASSGLDADLLDGNHASAFATATHSHGIGDVSGLQDALDAKLELSVNPLTDASVSNDTITLYRANGTSFTITTSDANTNYYLNGISKSGNTLTFSVSGATNQSYTFGSNAFTSYTDHSTQGYLTALPNHTHAIDDVDGLQGALDAKADASHSHSYLPLAGGTLTGGLTVGGSLSRGTYASASNYKTDADNIVLKGNSVGRSGIFFESEKDGTNINHPSDFAFIQYHAYGTGTTGESNELIIGVSNDADDHLVLNAPNVNGLKFRTGVSTTDYTVYHSGNLTLATLGYTGATNANYITNNNQLTNGAGYITGVAWNDITSKPSTFTPSSHTHGISEVDGLQDALDAKQAAGSYAAASHSHSIAEVTGLQTALNGKLSTTGKAADSEKLDGIDSASFLRSDADDTLSQTLVVNQTGINGNEGSIAYLSQGGVYIPRPRGAHFKTTSSTYTGAIEIILPATAWGDSDMLSFWVDIYDYAGGGAGESVSLYVYGYQYGTTNWTNCGATILSDRTDRDYNVRFGHNGTNPVVWIGETTSTWNYLQISVRDFQAGYSAEDWTRYDDGWAINVVTSLGTVNVTSSDNYPVAKQLEVGRTISLTGDVTGSVSFDGSSNVSITTAVANDSHTHDGRYYTETEADARFDAAGSAAAVNDRIDNEVMPVLAGLNTANWDNAYNNHITGIAVTGTTTKTITLTQKDGGTISAQFTDLSGAGGDGNDFITGGTWDGGSETLTLSVTNQPDVVIQLTDTMRDTNTTYTVGDGGLTQKNFTTALKTKLDGIAAGAEVNVQSDWNATSGDALILNKPTLGTAAAAAVGDFATAAQGALADSALQSLPAHNHGIAEIDGLQTALDGKVDDSQVLTNVPAGAVFTDTVYVHPTTAGNKHIPSGGSAGQFLKYSSSGTAVWATPSYTTSLPFTSITGTPTTLAGYGITDAASSSHTHTPSQVGLGNLSNSGNNLAGAFTATGDITAFSDIRVKENIQTIPNALESVCMMRGVTYNKIGEQKESVGVIAQEIKEVLPQVVHENEDGMLSVAYGNITGVLIEAIKEQQKQIEELKSIIDGFTK